MNVWRLKIFFYDISRLFQFSLCFCAWKDAPERRFGFIWNLEIHLSLNRASFEYNSKGLPADNMSIWTGKETKNSFVYQAKVIVLPLQFSLTLPSLLRSSTYHSHFSHRHLGCKIWALSTLPFPYTVSSFPAWPCFTTQIWSFRPSK